MKKKQGKLLTKEQQEEIRKFAEAKAKREQHKDMRDSSSVKGGPQKNKSKYTRKQKHKDDER